MVWITSSSCRGTTPPPQVPATRDWNCTFYHRPPFGTLPIGAPPATTAALRAFRGRNQLQQFLRIIKPLLEFRAQRLRSDLGCDADLAGRRIGRYKLTSLMRIEVVLLSPKASLDLFDHILGPGSAHGERPHQSGKIVLGDLVGKMDTGQAGRGQQLSEAALRLPRLQGNSVQQQLVFRRRPAGMPRPSPLGRPLAVRSTCFELAFGAFVVEPIQAHILHQYVQTVDKRPGGRDPAVFTCVCG